MTHIDLFSGIGGFALAAQWAGFRTIVFCEIDEYCQKILKIHWPEAPIISDIRNFDGTKWQGATLLTGGFPCQPFSVAGQRRGKEDNRYLWPEMFRVIKEAKPRWVLGENVAGIINMALDTCLSDLEGEGYETGTLIIPACAVNAPHRRDRVWIIAHNNLGGWTRQETERQRAKITISNSSIPDSTSKRLEGEMRKKQSGARRRFASQNRRKSEAWDENWAEVATRLCRMDNGIPNRVDRLKSLGNAIVPQVAYEIIKRIADIETQRE